MPPRRALEALEGQLSLFERAVRSIVPPLPPAPSLTPAPAAPAAPRRRPAYFETLGPRSAPPRGPGRAKDPLPARVDAAALYRRLLTLWQDPELAGSLQVALARRGYDLWAGDELEPADELNESLWSEDELAALAGFDDASEFLAALWSVGQNEALGGDVPARWVLEALADVSIARRGERPRLRLVLVRKDEAFAFVRAHHRTLPAPNPRGLLFAYGARYGARLVGVALVNTPSGAFRARSCPTDGVLELSRVATDGSVKFASSFLASRAIDLLPVSQRNGVRGCLLVTYSLVTEPGSTYLGLANRGLRPTRRRPGKAPSGARAGAELEALPHLDKIVWEAGPAADPPAWSVLEGVAPARAIGVARAEFDAWFARTQRAR